MLCDVPAPIGSLRLSKGQRVLIRPMCLGTPASFKAICASRRPRLVTTGSSAMQT